MGLCAMYGAMSAQDEKQRLLSHVGGNENVDSLETGVDIAFNVDVNERNTSGSSKWGKAALLLVVLATLGGLLFASSNGSLVMYSSHDNDNAMKAKSVNLDSTSLTRSTYPNKDAGWFMIYKATTSIATGTTAETGSIIKKYLYDVVTEEALGCDTYKQSVPAMFHQEMLGNVFQQGQLHFVDTDIFQTRGTDFTRIVDYIDRLGAEMNEFWHNKIQLYAPDFVTHYEAIYDASLPGGELENRVQLRLSKDSDDTQVAHVAFRLKTAGQVYEIIGSASSLSADQLAGFSEFGENECEAASTASISIAAAEAKYEEYYSSRSTSNIPSADGATYRYPLVLSLSIPVSTADFSSIRSTIDIFDDVINVYGSHNARTYTYGSSICSIKTLQIEGIEMPIQYVHNSAVASTIEEAEYDSTNTLIKYSVAAWEKDILQSHTELLVDGASSFQWDRYLDSHIGIQYFQYATTTDQDYCMAQSNAIKSSVLEHGQNVAIKTTSDNGQHFYTGSQGLRSIEYNTIDCFAQTTGVASICGCNAINNDVAYENHMNLTNCMGATVKDYSTTLIKREGRW